MRFAVALGFIFSTFFHTSFAVLAGPSEEEQLISEVYTQFNVRLKELASQSSNLQSILTELSEKIPESQSLDYELVEKNLNLLRQFSGGFFDYRSQRTIMWTEMYLNAFNKISIAEPDKVLGASQSLARAVADFKKASAELEPYDKKPASKNFLSWSNSNASILDDLFRSHKSILISLVEFNQNYFANRNLFSSLQNQVGFVLSKVNSFAEKLIMKRLESRIRNNQEFWSLIEGVIGTKYKIGGYKADFQKVFGEKPLKPGEVNVFLAPHGTPDEVALFTAKISRNLPPGRKAVAISAVYHFTAQMSERDREKGLEMGNALAAHKDIIAVMGALSPYKDEKIENRSLFVQVEEAIRQGATDFILFPEGRGSSYDGGFTPIHPNTSLALLYLAQKLKRSELQTSLKLTVLGASLPNLSYELGKDKDVMSLREIQEISGEALETFRKNPELLNHYVEFLWHRYTFKLHPHRFASTEADAELVNELFKKPNLLLGALRCPSVYKYVHSTFMF